MWFEEAVFYQIYPLGFCGAPFENDGKPESRILKVMDWIPHMKKLGINAIYFSPVFESDTHGYNTRDYGLIDTRLGTNDDFKKVVAKLHKEGIISDALYSDLDNWRASRNRALHNMAKIEEGDAPVFDERYSSLLSITQKGYSLFRKLETEIR